MLPRKEVYAAARNVVKVDSLSLTPGCFAKTTEARRDQQRVDPSAVRGSLEPWLAACLRVRPEGVGGLSVRTRLETSLLNASS